MNWTMNIFINNKVQDITFITYLLKNQINDKLKMQLQTKNKQKIFNKLIYMEYIIIKNILLNVVITKFYLIKNNNYMLKNC